MQYGYVRIREPTGYLRHCRLGFLAEIRCDQDTAVGFRALIADYQSRRLQIPQQLFRRRTEHDVTHPVAAMSPYDHHPAVGLQSDTVKLLRDVSETGINLESHPVLGGKWPQLAFSLSRTACLRRSIMLSSLS